MDRYFPQCPPPVLGLVLPNGEDFHGHADHSEGNMTRTQQLAQRIRHICSEVLQWEGSLLMATVQSTTETVMHAFILVREYVELLRQHSNRPQNGVMGVRGPFGVAEIVKGIIQQHFAVNVEPVIWAALHDPQRDFVQVYSEQWGQFIAGVAHLRTIFLPGDVAWVELNPSCSAGSSSSVGAPLFGSRESRSVEWVAFDLWKTRILQHAEPTAALRDGISVSVLGRLSMEVNNLLEHHRELIEESRGDCASTEEEAYYHQPPSRPVKLKKLEKRLRALQVNLSMLPAVHTTDIFLEEYLRRMKQWHHQHSAKRAGVGVEHYVTAALTALAEERYRAKLCFDAQERVTQSLLEVLLEHLPLNVTRENLFTWMEAVGDRRGCIKELHGVFQLVAFEDPSGGIVGKAFTEYATLKIYHLVEGTLSLLSPAAVRASSNSLASLEQYERACDEVLFSLVGALWHLERIVSVALLKQPRMQEAIETGLFKGAGAWQEADLSGLVDRLAVMVHFVVRRGDEEAGANGTLALISGPTVSSPNSDDQHQQQQQQDSKWRRLRQQDVVRLFYLLHRLNGKDKDFLREHQRLLGMRLTLFYASQVHRVEERARFMRQNKVEKSLLNDFHRITNDVAVYRCGRMLATAHAPPYLIVESHRRTVSRTGLSDLGSSLNTSGRHDQGDEDSRMEEKSKTPRTSMIRRRAIALPMLVESRVIPAWIWQCPTGGEAMLRGFPLLEEETQRSRDRFQTSMYLGRYVELCGPYTTGVMRVRLSQFTADPPITNTAAIPVLTHLRLELSLVQMCTLWCFQEKPEWGMKALRDAVLSGGDPRSGGGDMEALHMDFLAGLSALCAKHILHPVEGSVVRLTDLTTLRRYYETSLSGSSPSGGKVVTVCVIPEVLSRRDTSTSSSASLSEEEEEKENNREVGDEGTRRWRTRAAFSPSTQSQILDRNMADSASVRQQGIGIGIGSGYTAGGPTPTPPSVSRGETGGFHKASDSVSRATISETLMVWVVRLLKREGPMGWSRLLEGVRVAAAHYCQQQQQHLRGTKLYIEPSLVKSALEKLMKRGLVGRETPAGSEESSGETSVRHNKGGGGEDLFRFLP